MPPVVGNRDEGRIGQVDEKALPAFLRDIPGHRDLDHLLDLTGLEDERTAGGLVVDPGNRRVVDGRIVNRHRLTGGP